MRIRLTCLIVYCNVAFALASVNPFQTGFVKNEGFITYNNGQVANDILYNLATNSFLVELRPNGFSYSMTRTVESTNEWGLPTFQSEKGQRIDVVLQGVKGPVQIIESKEGNTLLQRCNNQYAGNMQTLKHFNRIVYKGIYKGIDIEFLVNSKGQFKYNFLLAEGADEKQIVLNIIGANQSTVNAKGNLEIITELGSVEEKIPLSYETNSQGAIGKTFLASYVQLGLNQFGFKFSGTQKSTNRLVDPVPYCSYLGGNFIDYAESIVVDDTGNFYVYGRTTSTSAIATPGAYQTSHSAAGNNQDLFISKFNKEGTLLWGTYYGGIKTDRGLEIGLDNDGNILICGFTSSTAGIATTGAFQTTLSGTQDAFFTKFSPSGAILWGSYYGFSKDEAFNSFAVDKDGDYYFGGSSNSTILYNQLGVHQSANAGLTDAILVKFSSNGIFKWGTYLGGTEDELIMGVKVDAHKNIYVAGSTFSSSGIATVGAYKPNKTANYDPFIVKFDSTGARVFGTYLGGNNTDYLFDLVLDHHGDLIFIGQTSSDSLLATSNAHQSIYGKGNYDGYFGKMDTAGNLLFLTYVGGSSVEMLTSVCVDKDDQIYIAGYSNSIADIATTGAYQPAFNGTNDAIFGSYTPNGSKVWMSYLGGSLYETATGICYSVDHALMICGGSNSSTNFATPGVYQSTLSGIQDAFFFKYYLPKDTCANPFKAGFTLNKLIQCERDNQFVFTDTTKSSTNATRIWDFGNGTFGSAQIEMVQYLPAVNNKFTVRLTVTDGNCIDSAKRDVFLIRSPDNKTIIGNILPRPGITETYTVPSTNGSNYKWVFESGVAVGTTFTNSIKIKWTTEDTVDLKVVETNGGGCVGDTNYLQVVVHDPTGIDEGQINFDVSIFPNPSEGLIYINYAGKENLFVEVLDATGRLLLEKKVYAQEPINLSGFSKGCYYFRIYNTNGYATLKKIVLID